MTEPKPKLRFNRKAMKRLRRERKMGHPTLARKLGWRSTERLARDWEAGWTAPSLDSIGRLALVLECEPADLLEWSTDEVTPRERRDAAAERDAAG